MVSKSIFAGAFVAGALFSVQAQAQAGYVTVTYGGTIDTVYDGSTFYLGEPIDYSVTFDPSKLKDVTSSANAVLAGFSSLQYGSFLSDSLSDDPRASLSIKVGDETFTKFSQVHYGTPDSDAGTNLGSGDFPIVEYLNGAFSGVGGVFYDRASANIALYTDAVAAALGDFDGHSFYIDDDTSDAEGDYDIRDAVFAAAALPEPASWAMMIGGFALVSVAIRRRRNARPEGGQNAVCV